MNTENDNMPGVKLSQRFSLYVYDGCHVDYNASIGLAYTEDNLRHFQKLCFEPECPDQPLAAFFVRAVTEYKMIYAGIIHRTSRLTPDVMGLHFAMAAFRGDVCEMNVWMDAGVNVRHGNDRALMSAILGGQLGAARILQSQGCEVTETMVAHIEKALASHNISNRDAVRHLTARLGNNPNLRCV